jgi:hypothetical protein
MKRGTFVWLKGQRIAAAVAYYGKAYTRRFTAEAVS